MIEPRVINAYSHGSSLSGAWEGPGRNLVTKIIWMDSEEQGESSCINPAALAALQQL